MDIAAHSNRQRLPVAAYDLAMRLGADQSRTSPAVQLRQTGRMKQVGTSRWMDFRAKQTTSNARCAFDWRARTGPLGMVFVRDALTEAGGRCDARVLGFIPVARVTTSTALTRGELMRYLAELAWAPDAILLNDALHWRPEGPDKLFVAAGSGDTAAEIMFSLDGQGRIREAFAPDRPRAIKRSILPTPWRGRFSDYRRHRGMWLPFAGAVAWIFDDVEDVCWHCALTHWERQHAQS